MKTNPERFKHALLPDSIELKVVPLKKRTKGGARLFELSYRETYFSPPKGMAEDTAALIDGAKVGMTCAVTRKGKDVTISIGAVCERERIGNMLFGEFICWSSLGHMTITDLWIGAGSMAFQKKAEPASP
jgi:hypothetical protein